VRKLCLDVLLIAIGPYTPVEGNRVLSESVQKAGKKHGSTRGRESLPGTTRRVLRTTTPAPLLNHANNGTGPIRISGDFVRSDRRAVPAMIPYPILALRTNLRWVQCGEDVVSIFSAHTSRRKTAEV